MKHSRKAITLLTVALFSSAVSCGDNEVIQDTNVSDTSLETSSQDRLDELGAKDFGGKTFTILDANGAPNTNVNIPEEEENGEVINDALIKRDNFIDNLYKVSIEYVQTTSSDGINLLKNSVLADERAYDLVFAPISGDGLNSAASAGVLANMDSFDELSLDKSWWSPLIYSSLSIDGHIYYTGGDIAPSIYCAPGCIYLNKELAKDYQISIDDVYDSVNNGKWTVEYLTHLTKDLSQDLNNDDTLKADDDFFGFLNEPNGLSAAVLLAGSGIDLSSIDKNGQLTTTLGNEATYNAIDKLQALVTNAPYNNLHSAFIEDRAIFMLHYVSSAYSRYRDMTSDFAILPIPKYDENQSTYRSLVNTWCNSFVGIPANVDSTFVPFITEALAYYSHENVRPYSYENAFKEKGARDERDAEMLDLIFDTLYLDFNSFINFGGSLDKLASALFKGGSFSSDWASIKESVIAEMDEFRLGWTQSE